MQPTHLHLPADVAFSRGTSALLLGQPHKAQQLLARAVESAPFDFAARFNYAVALRLLGRVGSAIDEANAAKQLSPRSPNACVHVGALAELAGKPLTEAIQCYEDALALDPAYAAAHAHMGAALRAMGQGRRAHEHYVRALETGAATLPAMVLDRLNGLRQDLERDGLDAVTPTRRSASATMFITEVLTRDGPATLPPDPPDLPDPPDVSDDFDERERRAPPRAGREVTLDQAAELLRTATRVVALTGAGMSAESGLQTRKELWERFDKDESVAAIRVNQAPWMLWTVVRDFLGDQTFAPNAGHLALRALPRLTAIVTQNVDDLHQRAAREHPGPDTPVIELHGTLERTYCGHCGEPAKASAAEFVRTLESLPPLCSSCRRAEVRPDVVLFGEWVAPERLQAAVRWVRSCDLLLVIGCAMDVAPASELPRLAARHGAQILEIKRNPSRITNTLGTNILRATAATALPALYRAIEGTEALSALGPLPSPRANGREPPLVPITLGSYGVGATEGTLLEWQRRVGDVIRVGDVLTEVEFDKATVELTATRSGTLRAIVVPKNGWVGVGGVIALLEPTPDDVSTGPVTTALERRSWGTSGDARLTDVGVHTPAVRAVLERLANHSILRPDSELALDRPGGTQWVRDRFAEHWGALGTLSESEESEDLPAISLWFTHDAREAAERWRQSWWPEPLGHADAPADAPALARWHSLLRAQQHRAVKRAPPNMPATAQDMVKAGPGFGHYIPSLNSTIELALTYVAGANERYPIERSPWAPLLELWLRGVWPFLLLDSIGVYVPHWHDGHLMPVPLEPDVSDLPKLHPTGRLANFRSPFTGGLETLWPPPHSTRE